MFFFFCFCFFSEDRSNNRRGLSLHFTQEIFYFTCPSRMHCTCHIWSKWTPWRIIISFSGSGPFDPSLRYLGYREVFSFFASPSYKKLPWAHHSLFNFQPPTYASFISVHSYLRLSVSLGNCKTTDFITSSVCEISLKVKLSFSRTKRTLYKRVMKGEVFDRIRFPTFLAITVMNKSQNIWDLINPQFSNLLLQYDV